MKSARNRILAFAGGTCVTDHGHLLAGPAGIDSDEPSRVLADANLGKACAPLVARAREHFRRASEIMARQTRASVKAPRIMAEAYAPMLDRLRERGFAAPRERVRIDRLHLLMAVLRYGIL